MRYISPTGFTRTVASEMRQAASGLSAASGFRNEEAAHKKLGLVIPRIRVNNIVLYLNVQQGLEHTQQNSQTFLNGDENAYGRVAMGRQPFLNAVLEL